MPLRVPFDAQNPYHFSHIKLDIALLIITRSSVFSRVKDKVSIGRTKQVLFEGWVYLLLLSSDLVSIYDTTPQQ